MDENCRVKLTLKAARVNVGITQDDAAQRFGVSKRTLVNWEQGRTFPDVSKIKMIEKVYGVKYDDIIFLQ